MILAITTTPNTSFIDIFLQWSGLILSTFLSFYLIVLNIAPKLQNLRLYMVFSAISTACMAAILKLFSFHEYAHIYWICQSISYLLELSVCLELAKLVMRKNWYVLAIFAPAVSAMALTAIIIYGMPNSIDDVVRASYCFTGLSGFMLLIVWLFNGKIEKQLEQPYSGIYASFGYYIVARFIISYIVKYYNNAHWNVIGRLEPINEIILLIAISFFCQRSDQSSEPLQLP